MNLKEFIEWTKDIELTAEEEVSMVWSNDFTKDEQQLMLYGYVVTNQIVQLLNKTKDFMTECK